MTRILFWNIENFEGDNGARAEAVVNHIKVANADVLGFSEIKDKAALRSILQESLIDYDFGITDGQQGIELLAGWKKNTFDQALFTQRREFKAGNTHLRPGSLLSIKRASRYLNLLFLHTDSGRKDRDYNNRQDMFEKVWSLRERLSEIEGSSTEMLVLGDLNTMGRQARGDQPEITGNEEIANLAKDSRANGMTLLDKDYGETWAQVNGRGHITLSSNLDHVIATNGLRFTSTPAVMVRGWNNVTSDAERFEFVEKISDHCSIQVEVLNF